MLLYKSSQICDSAVVVCFVDYMLYWGCVCFCYWLVSCMCYFLFVLIFCLSTCCVHFMETAKECVFLEVWGWISLDISQANTDKK